ncbi:protein SERAC1 [Microdochium nivale]|nr:protein SERAC1 [Microdochium nivale]
MPSWNKFKIGRRDGLPSGLVDEGNGPRGGLSLPSRSRDDESSPAPPSRDSAANTRVPFERLHSERSSRSAISDINGQLFAPGNHSERQRRRSEDRRDDPLGLTVLYEPEGPSPSRSVDILFIHGLGGTSLRTWCHNRDLQFLWPQLWLCEESELASARVLTYGYNAHFAKTGENASLSIGDFASDMLFRMRYAESGPHRLGQVPIIVVAHSMGGLVFKKAFVHGLLNEEFRAIISVVKSVVFLATPHRGSNLSDSLNKILKSSVFGHSPKDYVAELARRSPTIDELNESFRHHASKLQIFSFYETLSTNIGPISTMIVEKDAAILGYPAETVQPLMANHHGVCKFGSRTDPNYTSVAGVLRSLVATTVITDENSRNFEGDLRSVKSFCGVSKAPEEDLAVGRSVRRPGTFEDFLSGRSFLDWSRSVVSQILWVHAGPGNGKSTLCSMVIDHLLNTGKQCCYYFYKHNHLQKRKIANMLKSFALQSAAQSARACEALAGIADSGAKLDKTDLLTIWRTLFLETQAAFTTREDVYWVIDAADESESPRQLIELLSTICDFTDRVHLILFSRLQPSISQAIQKARKKVTIVNQPLTDNTDDIRLAITDDIEFLPSNDVQLKTEIANTIAQRAQGNFLWASLVAKQVVECRRRDQIMKILETTPDGMDSLYDRMLQAVSCNQDPEDANLAQIFLTWAMYARRPLTVEELSGPYHNELQSVMDLKHMVHDVCGQFVTINTDNKITLIHHSAKEYLQRQSPEGITLDSRKGHETLLGKCLVALCDSGLKGKLQSLNIPAFLQYAATSWVHHLENCSVRSDRVLNGLVRFFQSHSCLTWVQYMAMGSHLSDLPDMARKITMYTKTRNKLDAEKSPLLHRTVDLSLIETWASDLSHLAVKFGRNLQQEPSMVFKCVPALCPASSPLQQQFSAARSCILSLTSKPSENWDDCIARVSTEGGKALRLASSALFLAVAHEVPRGSVTLWDTTLYQESRSFIINQRISCLEFNKTGQLLACCGVNRTVVWAVKDASTKIDQPNPPRERAIALAFDDNDTLYMATDLRRVYKLCTRQSDSVWTRSDTALLQETNLPSGVWLSTPSGITFNSDCTQVAVAYKAFAPTIWSLDPPRVLARFPQRTRVELGRPPPTSHSGTSSLVWHPSGSFLFGIHGEIFKWDPSEDTYEVVQGETDVTPNSIQCSPNGLVFITGDTQGSIRIYDVGSMALLYKLTSEDGTSRISFSPDSLRFYDIRGSYCSVWEPNCLSRIADAALSRISDSDSTDDSFWSDDQETASVSLSFTPSESHADSISAMATLAATLNLNGRRLAGYSLENGVVELCDLSSGFIYSVKQSTMGAITEHIACSSLEPYLALSDTYGAVSVARIILKDKEVKQTLVYSDTQLAQARGTTRQLLFVERPETGSHLLITGEQRTQIVCLQDGSLSADLDNPHGEHGRWECLPENLVCVTTTTATVYDLDLKQCGTIRLSLGNFLTPNSNSTITQIIGSFTARHVLLRVVTNNNNRRRHSYRVLATSAFACPYQNDSPSVTEVQGLELPTSLSEIIRYPLGILPSGDIVFVDKALWICTAQLSDPKGLHKRHFFVPNDWLTTTGMLLARLLEDGTVICPSKGRLVVLKSDIGSQWR